MLHREHLNTLPVSPAYRIHLETLCNQFSNILREDLLSLCMYGSAVRGEWDRANSDLNLLIVLQTTEFSLLEPIAPLISRAHKEIRLAPFILTPNEIKKSSDVYCIKFEDIKRHHVCIFGSDPLEGLEIDMSHKRFVCEFELRNIALRMRMLFSNFYGQKILEQNILMRLFRSAMFPLRALLDLLEEEHPVQTPEMIRVLGKTLNTDIHVLDELLTIHREGQRLEVSALTRLYTRFNRLILIAVDRVDALEE